MPLVQTRGAASAQGFGEFAQASAVNYIEDVFSTYLYTGNNTTNNIVNGIDLAGKGGLVWAKARNLAGNHYWVDTARGAPYGIRSSTTGAQTTSSSIEDVTAFNSNGFSLGIGSQSSINNAGEPTVSWTFRKQPKMFDIQTWTGSGANRTIAHSLGSVPGCIIVKRTDTTADWAVYHRSLANTQYLVLNTTAAAATGATWWNSTTPTSAVFSVGTDASVNASGGGTYVAYLFAHDAGGFGLAGTDNVISCGSYTGNGSATGPIITLGYEPQWILLKQSSSAGNEWYLHDSMRGMPVGSADRFLNPNSNAAESSNENLTPLATGFQIATANGLANGSGETYIYIAIRRGPMKVPTLGTSVYNGVNNNSGLINVGFVPDLALINTKAQWDRNPAMARLTGTGSLRTNATNAEETQTIYWD